MEALVPRITRRRDVVAELPTHGTVQRMKQAEHLVAIVFGGHQDGNNERIVWQRGPCELPALIEREQIAR